LHSDFPDKILLAFLMFPMRATFRAHPILCISSHVWGFITRNVDPNSRKAVVILKFSTDPLQFKWVSIIVYMHSIIDVKLVTVNLLETEA
jgi:hypothetical protein